MKLWATLRSTGSIIVVLITVSVLSAFSLVLWREPLTEYLGADIYNLTYQFSLLTVLGGAVSYLYRELSREREERAKQQADLVARREAARSALRQYSVELTTIYNEVSEVGLLARAKDTAELHSEGGGGEFGVCWVGRVVAQGYDEHVQRLLRALQELGLLTQRADAKLLLYYHEPVVEGLTKAQDYLEGLVGEYVHALRTSQGNPPTIDSSEVPLFWEFVGLSPGQGVEGFGNEFARPFFDVIRKIDELAMTL